MKGTATRAGCRRRFRAGESRRPALRSSLGRAMTFKWIFGNCSSSCPHTAIVSLRERFCGSDPPIGPS